MGWHIYRGRSPITTITTLVIRADLINEFDSKWLELRQTIQKALECEHLPPIHLRLMYGKTLPKSYRSKPNAYLQANFEQIISWISQGVKIISHFSQEKYGLSWVRLHNVRRQSAENIIKYVQDPILSAELKFLKQHSYGNRKDMASRYLKRVASPLLPLIVESLLYLNETVRIAKGSHLNLKIDPFSDSHGLDTKAVFEAINSISRLAYISNAEVMQDTDQVQIAQAADLLGYFHFRSLMASYKHIKADDHLIKISNLYPFKEFSGANIEHIINRRYGKKEGNRYAATVPIHYAVARRIIEQTDKDFADQYMVSIEELKFRAEQYLKAGKIEAGLSILKDPSVCQHLIMNQNGEDPR
jgi:hypothetical protein